MVAETTLHNLCTVIRQGANKINQTTLGYRLATTVMGRSFNVTYLNI